MPERKYMSHSAKDYTGVRTKRSIKDGMGRPVVSRADNVKQYKNSENKWKKELKALKNQSKMLYSIAKKFGSRRDIKKTKKIREKSSKKSSDSSSDYSDPDS